MQFEPTDGETLKVVIESFQEGLDNRGALHPGRTMLIATLVEGNDALGLSEGERVYLMTSEHPTDTNRLIHDMISGSSGGGGYAETPQCLPGTVVDFSGCTLSADDNVIQASSFEISETELSPGMSI